MSAETKFIKKDLEELDNMRYSRRGRVSYPILKGFMETGYQLAEVQQEGSKRKPFSLAMLLRAYIERHNLPIKTLMRGGKLFLMRLDIDDKGNPIEDWQQKLIDERNDTAAKIEDITAEVIDET